MRQEHNPNGTIILSFDAYLQAPHAGETGTLKAFVTDGSAQWAGSKQITIGSSGENNFTLQVFPPDFPETAFALACSDFASLIGLFRWPLTP